MNIIEEAAKAMYFEDCGVAALDDDAEPFREMARVAFAVFEQAHAKELDTSPEPVKNGGDSLHVEQAHTPTDDERAKAANDAYHAMVDEAEAEGGAWWGFSHQRDAWEDGYQQGLAAALRRAAVPEPQGEPTDVPDGNGHHWMPWSESGKNGTYCRNCGGWAGKVGNRACEDAQGEPTDAQVQAAHEAFWASGDVTGGPDAIRAALRAAAGIGQEEKR